MVKKRKVQPRSLDFYFTKASKASVPLKDCAVTEQQYPSTSRICQSQVLISQSTSDTSKNTSREMTTRDDELKDGDKSTNNSVYENDIGSVSNTSKISDSEKYNLLKNHWKPPSHYRFPFSLHKVNGKEVKRYLGLQHFENHKWLVLSHLKQGLFCKYCVLFSGDKVGHNKGVTAQKFVSKPVTTFSKLFGKDGYLISHENTNYHKQCVQAAQDFVNTFEAPDGEVINQINKQRLQQVEENRARLLPIVETILFLGRQNIPLRGHRDDGLLDDEAKPSNDGNFRELLKFKVASGDNNLKMHLATASARATYIGKNTQNEIINCCGDEITSIIIKRVQQSGYYSILFDETTDISHIEQLSFSVRYIHNGAIHEDFLKFVDAYADPSTIAFHGDPDPLTERKLSGKTLGTIVLKIMKELNLDLNLCVGIGTDNCSVMASEVVGAVKEISDQATNACRVPCYNHALNNSLSKSSTVVNIRNAVGIMKSVISFFNMSAKRNLVIKNILNLQLSGLCETRWAERHDGVLQFKMYFTEIVEALSHISTWKDTHTSSKATSLLHALCSPEFIISTFSLADILQVTLPISRLLQLPSLDLNRASNAIQTTLTTLENKRSDCVEVFAHIFSEARDTARSVNIEIILPRIVGRQTNRENYESRDPEEYFRRSIFIPLLENICQDMKGRFGHSTLHCFGLRNILPKVLLFEEGEVFQTKKIN